MRAPFASKEASWDRLMTRIEVQDQGPRRSKRWAWTGIAAGVALAMGVYTMLDGGADMNVATGLAEHQVHTLPDGSVVTLNAQSSLQYNADDFATDRSLVLDGEAFFQVEKGSSFAVETDKGTVTVLGTSFNVHDRGELLEVTCMTGRVAVDDGESRVVLTPGLACNNEQGRLSEAFAEADTHGWMSGSYNYEEENLTAVLEEVERQFGMEMQLPDLSGRLYTGEFDSQDLETTLTVICGPMGLDYSIAGQTVMITLK